MSSIKALYHFIYCMSMEDVYRDLREVLEDRPHIFDPI
jgi:hypothetical protein